MTITIRHGHPYVNVNGAYNKNKVGNIPNEDGIIHGETGSVLYDNSGEFYRASNGEPIGYFWGYKTAGIFQNQQDINDWIAAGNGVLQSDVKPGDVKYYDINHDGLINESDKVNLGNGMPDFTYGFSIGFDWKNFDFSIQANGQTGNKIVQTYRNVGNTTANYTTKILELQSLALMKQYSVISLKCQILNRRRIFLKLVACLLYPLPMLMC